MKKTETLYFRKNLSPETIEKMKEFRKAIIGVSEMVEGLGESRETSLAFTHLESALYYGIKHLCLIDPQATLEGVD